MKKFLFTTGLALFLGFFALGQTFESRVAINEYGYLTYEMRETSGTGTPTTAMNVTDIAFQLRWPQSDGADIDLEPICPSGGNYYIADGLGAKQTFGATYYYRTFYANSGAFAFPNNWVQNQWEVLATFKVTQSTSLVVDITVAPDGWVAQGLNLGINAVANTPTVNGSVNSYNLPTLVYNYVWEGGTAPPSRFNRWEEGGNWRDECGGAAGGYPYFGEANAYALIPSGKTYYPETTTGVDDWGWACEGLLIESGAHIIVPDLTNSTTNPRLFVDGNFKVNSGGTLTVTSTQPTYATVSGDATIEGDVFLQAGTYLDVDGNMAIPSGGLIDVAAADATNERAYLDVAGTNTLDATPGIILHSTQYGTASYIDGGLAGSGTATVGRYLSDNSSDLGDYYFHQVCSPVNNVYLIDYDVDHQATYAFTYNGSLTYPDQWENIFFNYTPIPTMMGMMLGTLNSATAAYDLTFTNTINSGPQSKTIAAGLWHLVGNPYPSPIDANELLSDNPNLVDGIYIWDEENSGGNYRSYVGGSGNSSCEFIQIGQSFFIESNTATSVVFDNDQRVHTHAPYLKEEKTNHMRLFTQGGNSTWDEVYFWFKGVEGLTHGYDMNHDGRKWASMYGAEATEMWTVGSDGEFFTIDARNYDSESISVPLHFKASVDATYTIGTEGIESFDADIDVFLEDTFMPEQDWVNLKEEGSYEFTSSPEDEYNRFVLHFFHKSFGLEELDMDAIHIYSNRTDAVITNNSEQLIREILVYDMMGNLMIDKVEVSDSPIRMYVSDKVGYYIVKVITDKAVYSEKVFISK